MQLKVISDSPADTAGDMAADKNTKSVTTNMMRRSGETGVIGGIYDTVKQTTELGIPFFSDLPIIGLLFKSTTTKISQQEFLVMVTPKVLERSNFDSATNDMDSSSEAYESTKENVYDNTANESNSYQEAEENFEDGGANEFANTSDPEGDNYESENTANDQESNNQANSQTDLSQESENSEENTGNEANEQYEENSADENIEENVEENAEESVEESEVENQEEANEENYSDEEDAVEDDYEGEE